MTPETGSDHMKRLTRSATFNVHFVTQVSGPDNLKFGSPSVQGSQSL